MDKAKLLEIMTSAQQAAADAVKKQIAAGAPNRGMPKARQVAVVAYVIQEVLASHVYSATAEADLEVEQKEVLRAALSGSLLNASQFRQELEKAGVLEVETPVSSQYAC
jgi:hypothetical protein